MGLGAWTPLPAADVGSAFTYQGQLRLDGVPAVGAKDFMFTLHDAPTLGAQIGDVIYKSNVMLSSSLFSVELDFGAGSCNGGARWLEIGVKPAGSGDPYTILSPRQSLTATPYAQSLMPGAIVKGDAPAANMGIVNAQVGGAASNVDGEYGARLAYLYQNLVPIGLYAYSTAAFNFGIYGKTSGGPDSIAIYGEASGARATGVQGDAYVTTSVAYGVRGYSQSPDGYGGYFGSEAAGGPKSSTGAGVMGVSAGGSRSNTHPGGLYYPAGGEFAGSNGVIGAATTGQSDGYGVTGFAPGTAGRAVWGKASSATGTNYGVYGQTSSASGYGGYFEGAGGGVALKAGGSGIIKSTADTEIAVSPLKMLVDPGYAHNAELRPTLGGYLVARPTEAGASFAILPVDLPVMLFGARQKLKSVSVTYRAMNASSYIDEVQVRYTDSSGVTQYPITDSADRNSTTWQTFTIDASTPAEIGGSVLAHFELKFAGTGPTHEIAIGRVVLTLTEN